jgi:hypothetical protein
VLVFGTELPWQQAGDSIFDAKVGSANLAAQLGIHNSIAEDSGFPDNCQFTRILVAAENGDHILWKRVI